MAVDRGVADAGPAGDLVERHVGAELDEHLAGGGDDPLPVAQGVGARPGHLALHGRVAVSTAYS